MWGIRGEVREDEVGGAFVAVIELAVARTSSGTLGVRQWCLEDQCKVVNGGVLVAASFEPSSMVHGKGRMARMAAGRSCGPVRARIAVPQPNKLFGGAGLREDCESAASVEDARWIR